jgi:hypothetical protein
MFGLLWERSRRVWVPAGHIAPFPRVVKTAFPPCTIFVLTSNETGSLEQRFLSRCPRASTPPCNRHGRFRQSGVFRKARSRRARYKIEALFAELKQRMFLQRVRLR